MASAPLPFKPPAKKSADGQDDPLLKAMDRLIARAKTDRSRHQARIADCYRYTMPWRHKFYETQPGNSYDEIFDETPATVLEDFSADMLNTFTPQKNNWLSEEPVVQMREADQREIGDMLKARQTVIFSEMSRSSLYQALQEAYLDLGPGTMALLIQDIGATEPFHCEAIPSTDLLITRGPYGLVDGILRCKKYRRGDAKTLWKQADWTKLGPEPQQDADEQELEITDGCWRDWSEKGTETYNYVVQCQSKKLWHKVWKGAGSCPFIVARWARDATTAWGVGPTYRVLPAIKTLNHVRYLDLKNYDKYVDPPFSFEDDGVANFDAGIIPGMAMPRAIGSEAPETLESKARFDISVFERDELRSIIKRAHYQDRPEQLGKTPPTAFQWQDERAERARRMGTPATNLVLELQIPIYKRFSYMLGERGTLPKVQLNGEAVALQPISPLLRAQQQEKVLINDRFVEMTGGRFGPAMLNIIVDQFKHCREQAELMGYNLNNLRDEAQIKQAIEQLSGLLQQGNAPPGVDAAGITSPGAGLGGGV
ncbi:MAG: head-tail connector protein [Actinobacteria bacterium]|nr:head-tail connector protein [Actinomycetota bacterium]